MMSNMITHPVIEVLMSRKSQGSTPGNRQDDFRVGLAVEGGGMRGVLSAAMLTALVDYDLVDCFDAVYAYSAAAVNAVYFASGGGWHSLSIYYDELIGSEFISYGRFARGGPLVSLDFVLDVVLEQRNPLDYQRVIDSPIELHLIASSIDQLKPVAFKNFTTKEEVRSALKASACIPLVAGPPAIRNGERFVDGMVLLSHPFTAAAADGCTHVLVIRTRPEDTSAGRMTAGKRLTASRMERLQPGMRKAMFSASAEYGPIAAEIRRRTSDGDGPPYAFEVGCPPGSHRVGRFTQDRGLIYEGIRVAYGAMLAALTGRRQEILLRPLPFDLTKAPTSPLSGPQPLAFRARGEG